MPRTRRLIPPGTVQHVIGRFVDSRHFFDLPGERFEYLHRLATALAHHDAELRRHLKEVKRMTAGNFTVPAETEIQLPVRSES
jgi:hypothetical protein